MFKKPTLITITAPTCAGKSTILDELCKDARFHKVVSFTTRPPRTGEVAGSDYYFMDDAIVKQLQEANMIAEYNVFGGYSYGITHQELSYAFDSGLVPVVIVDPNGVEQLEKIAHKHNLGIFEAFVYCNETLRLQRLNARTTKELQAADTPEKLEKIVSSHTKRVQSAMGAERNWAAFRAWNVYLPGDDVTKAIQSLYLAIESYNKKDIT
jgi:guanylate kinase